MSAIRARVGRLLRSPRLRTVVLLVAGYKTYQVGQNYNVINKPFSHRRHRPGETVLDLNLDSVHVATNEVGPSFISSTEELRLSLLIDTLRAAKADPRVTGLVVHGLSGLSDLGPAGLNELRTAVADFSTGWGGKHTLLHLPAGLGAAGNGTIPLHFASAFDSVHVQPASPVIIPGISLARLFFKRTLEKAGLKARTITRHEYKAVGNPFSEEQYTRPHAESMRAILDAFMSEIVSTIAKDRSLSEEAVRGAFDDAILSAEEAAARGLVDTPLHRDQLPATMRARLQEAVERRAANRHTTATEWNDAMTTLRQAWNAPGGPREFWQEGAVVSDLPDVVYALQMATFLTDFRSKPMREAVEAQKRALSAHLSWLDSCPWEEKRAASKQTSPDTQASVENTTELVDAPLPTLLRSIPTVSASLAVERRLTEQALKALDEFPKLVEAMRQNSKDPAVLDLNADQTQQLVRWCRAVWRAMCLSSRMVDTLLEAEEQVQRARKSEDDEQEAEKDGNNNYFAPRPFLIGQLDEVEFRTVLAGDSPPAEAKQPNVANADFNVEQVTKKKSPAETRRLQYMRLADYAELVSTEMRAYAERSNAGGVRLEFGPASGVKDKHPDLSSQKLAGLISSQERNGLLRLQLAGHRLAPWRFNSYDAKLIAVINISGPITDERSDDTRAAIRRADKDPRIRAIVLRIDTPGGSVMASEEISRAVEVASKPVVASMGNTCASGGYYIAAPCDHILASPTTLTGSIGVIMQAFTSADLFERIGVTSDTVESGRFSKYFSALAPITEWSDDFASRIDTMIDDSYARFVGVVARGRNLPFNMADSLARGRIWAGVDAHKHGLVDELGGLNDAVRTAANLANLEPDSGARPISYPTMGMQVQEAARRRGLMPCRLDEEGDEAIRERRRPSSRWNGFFDRDGSDEEEEGAEGDFSEEAAAGVRAGFFPNTSFGHLMFDRFVGSLDSYLLSATHASFATNFVESGLAVALSALGGKRAANALADELKLAEATAGRPAAVGPNVHVE